jgi:drug/metabolite transporter (DMT)-like permease
MTTQSTTVAPRVKNATVTRFLLLALLWGSSFTFIKVSLRGLTPSQLVLSRLVLGALALFIVVRVRRVGLPRSAGTWGHIAVAALFGNVIPFLLLSYGERGTGAGVAGVLVGSTTLWTVAFGALLLPAERTTPRKTAGLIIGFVGVALVSGFWRDSGGSFTANLSCLGTAVSYGIGLVYTRKFISPRNVPPLAGAYAQLTAAVALQLLVLPAFAWRTPHLSAAVVGSILFLGIFSTGLAYVLLYRLISDIGATAASTVNYVIPVLAVVIGIVVLGERLSWNLVLGGLVIFAGLAYAERRVRLRPDRGSRE